VAQISQVQLARDGIGSLLRPQAASPNHNHIARKTEILFHEPIQIQPMAGGGGDISHAQQSGRGERRGHRQNAAWLLLDVIAEIAARSDPATNTHVEFTAA